MNLNREQIRTIVYYEYLDTKDSSVIFERMKNRLGDTVVSISTVKYWIREFKRGRQSVKDDPRSGRPVSATTDENINAVRDMVRADPQITFYELEEMPGITRGSLQRIIHDHLGLQKKFCKFVPHFLTEDQKRARVKTCTENLNMWRNDGRTLINKIISEDETYVHYYEPKSRTESKIWVFEDESPPHVVKKTKLSAKFFTPYSLTHQDWSKQSNWKDKRALLLYGTPLSVCPGSSVTRPEEVYFCTMTMQVLTPQTSPLNIWPKTKSKWCRIRLIHPISQSQTSGYSMVWSAIFGENTSLQKKSSIQQYWIIFSPFQKRPGRRRSIYGGGGWSGALRPTEITLSEYIVISFICLSI